MFTFCEETYARPDEAKVNTTMKDVKEPKDIKDAATASEDVKDAIKTAKEAKKNKKDCARVLVLSAIQSEMVMVEVINASSCYTEPGQSWRIRAIIKFAP